MKLAFKILQNLLFNMNCVKLGFIVLPLICTVQIHGSHICGIRRNFIPLIHDGWAVPQGQWPWHVGIHHIKQNVTEYACGGSLIDQKHIVTAAHCVVNRKTRYPLPVGAIELHFGQTDLSEQEKHVQIRDVVKIHVHSEYANQRNDIAVLELRLPVEFSDFVIPICLDMRRDKNLRDLEGQRGWITGWGMTNNETVSSRLQTASMPVVDYLQCVRDNPNLFGNILDSNTFCAGDRNGTSPSTGDSGGGMYFYEGAHWVLRGIVSFGKQHETQLGVDTSTYAVFVNVQRFVSWIQEITEDKSANSTAGSVTKRISERECERFRNFVRKNSNGLCSNARSPHTVSLVYADGKTHCTGILVNENHVLTAANCLKRQNDLPTMVRISDYGTVDVSSIIRHPKYRFSKKYYDVAIVRLNSSIELAYNVVPACLASDRTENLYDTLLTTGFHILSRTIFRPAESSSSEGLISESIDMLQFFSSEANRLITKDECNNLFDPHYTLREGIMSESQLCVINNDILATSAGGSSGSPLQTLNTRTCMSTVMGIMNFGNQVYASPEERDGNDTILDVYARVSYYLDWIEQTVWGEAAVPQTTMKALEETTTEQLSYVTDFVFPPN